MTDLASRDEPEEFVLGIDPGLDGASAVLSLTTGRVQVAALPTVTVSAPRRKKVRTLDVPAWRAQLLGWVPDLGRIRQVALENVSARPGEGVVSVFRFGRVFGELYGALCWADLPVQLVASQVWKDVVLPGSDAGKEAAIAYVHRHFDVSLRKNRRCRTDHDGMADAICLAVFAGRTRLCYSDEGED